MRTKNKMNMTITEQLEHIAEQICGTYCRYPDMCKEIEDTPEQAQATLENVYCSNCPLAKEL